MMGGWKDVLQEGEGWKGRRVEGGRMEDCRMEGRKDGFQDGSTQFVMT